MNQLRRYKKNYNGLQVDDDSSSHSTLQLSSHSVPPSSSIHLRTFTAIYNNKYNVSRAAISIDTTTTTVPSNLFVFRQPIRYQYTAQERYTTTENSRSLH